MATDREGRGLGAAARRVVVGAMRLLLGLVLLLALVALVLGRAERPEPPVLADQDDLLIRVGVQADGFTWAADRFFDAETGRAVAPSLPGGGELWSSVWAPWVDQFGRTQLIGLWKGSAPVETALIRVSEPGGIVLDRLPVDDLPNWKGACWFPDRSARVLLAGYDGRLYRLDFDGADAGPLRPRPVAWRGGPATGVARLNDLSWPRHPGFGGRLLASLSLRKADDATVCRSDPLSLWWLRLDPEADAVVAAGPLIRRAARAPEAGDERHAALSPAGSRPPAVAWLERPRTGEPWRLRVAPVEVDPLSGDPFASAARARTLAEGCAAVTPAFSADGRRITYVVPGPGAPGVRRVDVPGADAPGVSEVRSPDVVAGR